MQSAENKEKHIIRLEGKIDSSNVNEIEAVILKKLEEKKDCIPLFDASALEYISSAGLRMLMKIYKRYNEKISLTEVNPRIYDILQVTGFTELFDVKKQLRELSVEGCKEIGHGACGTVYQIDRDTIVKVYNSSEAMQMIENEKAMAKMAFVKGIPTAISYDIVKVGDKYGSVFELLKAKTFNDIIIEEENNRKAMYKTLKEYVDFLKLVHSTEMDPETLIYTRDVFIKYMDTIKSYLTQEEADKLTKMITALPDDNHVVHGDFQMKNVMLTNGEPMLIDMDTLSKGQPIFDLQAIYVTYIAFGEDDPGNSLEFLGIKEETANFIWNTVAELYLNEADAKEKESKLNKIKLLGMVRYLYILNKMPHEEGSLNHRRIIHAKENVKKLLPLVNDFIL